MIAPVVVIVASSKLIVIGQTRVLVSPDQSIVHGLEACALSLKAGQGHELPLLDEEVTSVLACRTDLFQLLAHELTL